MPTLRTAISIAALACASSPIFAQSPNLGRPVSAAELSPWDISIMPNGAGLPPGSGTPAQGERIFAAKCAMCHGENGRGGISAPLISRGPLDSINAAEKSIANFWPYPTTVFDVIRRAMPWQQPRSLTDNEVYALSAYILALNKLIGDNDAMNAETLPKVRMPNRDGFIVRFPDQM